MFCKAGALLLTGRNERRFAQQEGGVKSFFYQHAVPDGTQKMRQFVLHPVKAY
jgi:hypothetical protein